MQRLVLASHGYLAEGMKNSAQIIVWKSAKIYTICAYVKEGITLESQINELFDSFPEDDEMIVVTDIFGGSINNEFMIRAQEGGYWLIAGMNLPLVLSLWYETENLTEKQLETNISEASEGIVLCNKLLSEDTVEEDDGF